jgi:hypothetical protein
MAWRVLFLPCSQAHCFSIVSNVPRARSPALPLHCGVKKGTAIAVVYVHAEAVWSRHAWPYPLPAQERRSRAVSPEGIRCCDARRELHLRPGLEAWANGPALIAPLPQRVGNEKQETVNVAEACKLLATVPDGALLRYSADGAIFEIGQIELAPVTAQGDG